MNENTVSKNFVTLKIQPASSNVRNAVRVI